MFDVIGWYLWYKEYEILLNPLFVVLGLGLLKWAGGKALGGACKAGKAIKDRYIAFRKPQEPGEELAKLLAMQKIAGKRRGESVLTHAGRTFHDDGKVYVEVKGEKGLEDVAVPLDKWEKTLLMTGYERRNKELDAQHTANVRMAASSGATDLKESGDLIATLPKKA
jgi:hypothetical protein